MVTALRASSTDAHPEHMWYENDHIMHHAQTSLSRDMLNEHVCTACCVLYRKKY